MNDKENKDPLLDDEEFAALMQAEYENAGRPSDVIAKKRVWEQVINKVKDQSKQPTTISEPKRQSHMIWAAAAAIFLCIGTGIFVLKTKTEPEQTIKGLKSQELPITLSIYEYDTNGQLKEYDPQSQTAQTLIVFEGRSETRAFAALIAFPEDGEPEILLSEQEFIGGQPALFGNENDYIGIQLGNKNYRFFCAIAYSDSESLRTSLAMINAETFSVSGNCLAI